MSTGFSLLLRLLPPFSQSDQERWPYKKYFISSSNLKEMKLCFLEFHFVHLCISVSIVNCFLSLHLPFALSPSNQTEVVYWECVCILLIALEIWKKCLVGVLSYPNYVKSSMSSGVFLFLTFPPFIISLLPHLLFPFLLASRQST